MKMELVRSPRSQKRISKEIAEQLRVAYRTLGDVIISVANEDVADWEHKPEFRALISVTTKKYTLRVKYDGRTEGGKRYGWVGKGTASYKEKRSGNPYVIRAKKPSGVIYYELPNMLPKTNAYDGSLAHSYTDPPGVVVAKQVVHPGIKPRKFMEDYVLFLASRQSGSFHNITEAAIKRGLRRMRVRT